MLIELPTLEESQSAQALHQRLNLVSRALGIAAPGIYNRNQRDRLITLKMESELKFGSYKLRGVSNAIDAYQRTYKKNPERLLTVSAGNMAQAVAAKANELGIPALAVVPDTAPKIKTDAITSLGADIARRPMADVWNLVENPEINDRELLIHPLATPGILAGYGAIALEILEMNERPDAVFIPFGVGGLTLGIASIIKQICPELKIICVETSAAPTLTSALQSRHPVSITKGSTCADAIGTPRVVAAVFEIIERKRLVDDVVVVSEDQIHKAMRDLYLNHNVKVEGAAGAAYAAALLSDCDRPLVVVTGQNIDIETFKRIVHT